MNKSPKTWLMVTLLMFPQIVETIYSPALPHISTAFRVTAETASQTLSIYFIAFAFGIVFWGRLCDILGRRSSMIYGLTTYGAGALIALFSSHFETLLFARSLAAFGAAAGSIVTQTMLRDSFDGPELNKVFSIMGMGISISPILGLMLGGLIAQSSGYIGIFSFLIMLAAALWLINQFYLTETRPHALTPIPVIPLAKRMFQDNKLWRNAGLVALFNLMLFGYYSLAPFLFTHLGMSSLEFGYSGAALALGSLIGAQLNRSLIVRGWQASDLIRLASSLSLCGAIGVSLLQNSIVFLLPMSLVVLAFGVAIPNILSQALVEYRAMAGSAGALFGLIYYLLLGGSLALAAIVQNLGTVLVIAAGSCCLLSFTDRKALFKI